jgi:hypothetical protein
MTDAQAAEMIVLLRQVNHAGLMIAGILRRLVPAMDEMPETFDLSAVRPRGFVETYPVPVCRVVSKGSV